MRIALLEDDLDQSRLVQLWLSEAGHRVVSYGNGKDAIRGIFNESFDVLILDWLVPGMDGLEVLDWVRDKIDWPIPVLFITQKDTEKDVVTALKHGADDYMSKPIKRFEMLARVEAITRRVITPVGTEKVVAFAPYVIDCTRRRMQHNGDEIFLTDKEFDLAFFLFRKTGRALSRGHILESVWGRSSAINTRTVDTHISRLRRKLQISPRGSGWQLSSIYQHGYRLERVIF